MPPKTKSMRRQCGTMIVQQRLLERDPGFRMRLMALETQTANRMQTALALPKIRTIKVHVHVVYNTPAENVSDAQVKSQIKVLNRDFAAKNTDKSKTPAVWSGLVVTRESASSSRRTAFTASTRPRRRSATTTA